MSTNTAIVMLIYILIAILVLLFVMLGIFIILKVKEKQNSNISSESTERSTSRSLGANKQSIFNFMEFDTIDDSMIIQKDYTKFLMIVECQGINYDLMSSVEKTGVEEGFVQFLNSLRYPIQIYVQTRTVNLESSLNTYKEKVDRVKDKLTKMQFQYENMKESGNYNEEQIEKAHYEVVKQKNLYEYGKDIISNTEVMSLNKNILNKKYYIIVPYYSAELGSDKLDKEETKNLVFSELYTRAQSIIRSISSCGVRGKILRSDDLIELLYMAYNRDEAEVFGMDKAIKAGYNELYSTAPDVLNKKMKALDELIEEKAVEKVKETIDEVKSEKEMAVIEKEQNIDELIDEMAKLILNENSDYIGEDVAQAAIDKIDGIDVKNTKEGGTNNGEKKVSKRGRKPKKTE
jgi:hypothetical protein